MTNRPSHPRTWQHLRRWWSMQLPLPCARCGAVIMPGDEWDLDHMTPRWAGGTDDTARPSHRYCNRKLSNEHPQRVRYTAPVEDSPPTVSRRW